MTEYRKQMILLHLAGFAGQAEVRGQKTEGGIP